MAMATKRDTHSISVLEARGVTKVVDAPEGELRILDDINFVLDAGTRLAITGVSGSGKSTLISLLAGLDIPTSGSVRLMGNHLGQLDEDGRARLRRRHVGFVFQAFHLVESFTALENVMLSLELKGLPNARQVARDMLARVKLSERIQHYPGQLSGGEQQRVALARAFCTAPEILFADEPTGNLDQATSVSIESLLFELNADFGTTLLIVTHDQRLSKSCDRRIELAGGRIIADTETRS